MSMISLVESCGATQQVLIPVTGMTISNCLLRVALEDRGCSRILSAGASDVTAQDCRTGCDAEDRREEESEEVRNEGSRRLDKLVSGGWVLKWAAWCSGSATGQLDVQAQGRDGRREAGGKPRDRFPKAKCRRRLGQGKKKSWSHGGVNTLCRALAWVGEWARLVAAAQPGCSCITWRRGRWVGDTAGTHGGAGHRNLRQWESVQF